MRIRVPVVRGPKTVTYQNLSILVDGGAEALRLPLVPTPLHIAYWQSLVLRHRGLKFG